MKLKEKLHGGRSCFFLKGCLAPSPGVVLSCRATVGGFHSDSVFGVDTQISPDVNCLSVGPFWISTSVVTVFDKGFSCTLIHEMDPHSLVLGLIDDQGAEDCAIVSSFFLISPSFSPSVIPDTSTYPAITKLLIFTPSK